MERNAWMFCLLCWAVAPGASDAQGSEPRTPILIKLEGGGSHAAGPQTLSIVSGIYRQSGIELQWDETAVDVARVLTIVITTRDRAPAGVRIDAMGVAPTPGDGSRGTVAYIFLDAVQDFSGTYRVSLPYVLACAIAHEIGHLLLPPNAHRPDGIMRGTWYAADFPPKSPGMLGFPKDQARLLRLRASR
jgi:hypothetical protein